MGLYMLSGIRQLPPRRAAVRLSKPRLAPIGNLIAYEYLWHSQRVALIFAKRTVLGNTFAYAVAISHKPPSATERAIEVPRKLKRHLGLDEEPSWIYTDQVNEFTWPGPDLRPADRLSSLPRARGACVIGPLPKDWFASLKAEIIQSLRLGRTRIVRRTGR
jgi:hypothetical protein